MLGEAPNRRPDAAYSAASSFADIAVPTCSLEEQAGWLLAHIGPRVTAAAIGLTDARLLRRWRDGDIGQPYRDATLRLALLFRIAWSISSMYGDRAAGLFLRSANPHLDDCAPFSVLRDCPPEQVQEKLLFAVEALLAD